MRRKFGIMLMVAAVTLAGCSSVDPDRELTLQERDNLVVACREATKDEAHDAGTFAGSWQPHGDWKLTPGEVSRGVQGFEVTGVYDSDPYGPLTASCDVGLDVETMEATTRSHRLAGPETPYLDLAIEACHEAVLDKARFPGGVEFVETTNEAVTVMEDGSRAITVAGDVDVPNAFGTLERQGFMCLGVIVGKGGSVRNVSALVGGWLRGSYTGD